MYVISVYEFMKLCYAFERVFAEDNFQFTICISVSDASHMSRPAMKDMCKL
jgi:hypothetical protein